MATKIKDIAIGIINSATNSSKRKLIGLQATCNSDTAFVAAVKTYHAAEKLMKQAFLLSRTWAKLGQSRTFLITKKALIAAFKMLVEGFKKLTDVYELPLALQKTVKKLIDITTKFQLSFAF